ncbi:MAG: PilZ domain-containing protein [Candidatus Omnitrophota bacterium]|nr:MAG: PilZ domain-containing protein [Candidatus Omnitrophota bacterium]
MGDKFSARPSRNKRAFLRVPVRLRAKLYLKGSFYRTVLVQELSTNGVAFILKEESSPDAFDLYLQLNPFSKAMKIRIEVRNRLKVPGGFRTGCSFAETSEKDQQLIDEYISRFVSIAGPSIALNVGAFFCSIDASWRILAYAIHSYYVSRQFAGTLPQPIAQYFYLFTLLLYAALSFTAFALPAYVIDRKAERRFLLSMECLLGAFVFVVTKSVLYWQVHLWRSEYLLVRGFFWAQFFLACYVGLAIAGGIGLLRKIDLILQIEEVHRSHMR